MISQADIIRTLVNKNCTDELVMATALSPNCTPTKLLEVLTGTERWDLALDVSMKLGLDVSSLCKTWAMRCLKNRDFNAAREKFRRCFKGNRLPTNRGVNPIQSELLLEILTELSRMEENPIPLSEEIHLIKRGLYSETTDTYAIGQNANLKVGSITERATIYQECLYYLEEYGSTQDVIKFYLSNDIWTDAVRLLLQNCDKISTEKFFIPQVMDQLTKMGKFSQVLETFMQSDQPNYNQSEKYFRSIYNYCLRSNRYNTLYAVQSTIGDHIAAANTQIKYFYLARPTKNYRELNYRLVSLKLAHDNYATHLNKLEDKSRSNYPPKCNIFTTMSKKDINRTMSLIQLQIELTINFSLNEVTGCIGEMDLDFSPKRLAASAVDGSSRPELRGLPKKKSESGSQAGDRSTPVTIFDPNETRQIYLAALALIYYDLTCSDYITESGLSMARQLIEISMIDKMKVFKAAMRIVIEDDSRDIIENASLLLKRLEQEYLRDPGSFNMEQQLSSYELESFNSSSSAKSNLSGHATASSSSSSISIASAGVVGSSGAQLTGLRPSSTQLLSSNKYPPTGTTTTTTTRGASKRTPSNKLNRNHDINNKPGTQIGDRSITTARKPKHQQQAQSKQTSQDSQSMLSDELVDSNSDRSEAKVKNCRPLEASELARAICDHVIRDSIERCREPDYKMELAKLLSSEAKLELYIELGKLSNAQQLAFNLNRADYVVRIIELAAKLNQNHVRTVCQLWLAKQDSGAKSLNNLL